MLCNEVSTDSRQLQEYYHLKYLVVSLVFLSPLVGYTASALLNNSIHLKYGQRGVGILAPICHLIPYIVIAVHPPYPVLIVIFSIAGFGNGLADAAWNAWLGNMANPNEVLGFLHAFYGLGAVLAPLIATTMITKGHLPWYTFYYVMISLAFIELCSSAAAFWKADGAAFRAANPRTGEGKDNRMKEAIMRLPYARVTWCCSIFFLGYVGIEVALGGWIVKFMLEVRKGEDFASGMTATGFWMGITMGRLVLGFVTPRIGEKLAIAVCLVVLHHPLSNHPLTYHVDLPPFDHGPRTHLLAGPAVLCLRRGRRPARLLPGPFVPCRRSRSDKTPTSPSARERNWFRSRHRRVWRRNLPFRSGCDRTGKRCTSLAADYSGAVGVHIRGMALPAQVPQQDRVSGTKTGESMYIAIHVDVSIVWYDRVSAGLKAAAIDTFAAHFPLQACSFPFIYASLGRVVYEDETRSA